MLARYCILAGKKWFVWCFSKNVVNVFLSFKSPGKTIVSAKNALNYQPHPSIQALLRIAAAYEDRSLKKLEDVLAKNPIDDKVVYMCTRTPLIM